MRVFDQTGELPEELRDEPRLPELGELIYGWFAELSATRQSGMGANPISFSEIDAWARLTRRQLQSWHVRALRALDSELLRLLAQDQKSKVNHGH